MQRRDQPVRKVLAVRLFDWRIAGAVLISQGVANLLTSRAVRTRIFQQGEDLADFVLEQFPEPSDLPERSILAVTSKIVSLAEGRVVPASRELDRKTQKEELIAREADVHLGTTRYGVSLTVKQGILIPAAGIDESNSREGGFILFPEDPYRSARSLWERVTRRRGLQELGIIITDSHTHPLRRGVTGIGLAHWGFKATRKLVGHQDLFGRELQMTYVNALDALAVTAVYLMGEADESSPLAVIQGAPVEFTRTSSVEEIRIPPEEDIYWPALDRE